MSTVAELLAARAAPAAARSASASLQEASFSDSSDGTLVDALKSLGGMGLGAVATVGNFLDLPGSSIRDILTGNNPFDQWMSPFSAENRVSGRDMLTQWGLTAKNKETGISGWARDPVEAVRDIGGFFTEVFTDPFGPASKTFSKAAAPLAAIPGAAATGRVARNIFDTLPAQAIGRATAPAKRVIGSLFDKYAQGVTDPIVQPAAVAARKKFEQTHEKLMASATGTLQLMRQEGWGGEIDDAIDLTDPANLMKPGSKYLVKAQQDAIRRYLEAKDGVEFPDAQLTANDVVTVGESGALKEVEWINNTPQGRQVKLVGDDALYEEAALKPYWRQMDVQIPETIKPLLDNVKAMFDTAKHNLWSRDIKVSEWFDNYIDYAPRDKGDQLRFLESLGAKDTTGFRRRAGLARVLQQVGSRDVMYSGFKDGSAGVDELLNDPYMGPIVKRASDLATHLGGDDSVLIDYVSQRHVEGFADALGMTREELWDEVNLLLQNGLPRHSAYLVPSPDAPGMLRIFEGGKPVGRIDVTVGNRGGKQAAFVDNAFIDPASRGRGLMDTLYPQLQRYLQSQGVERIELVTPPVVGDKVWSKFGFSPDGIRATAGATDAAELWTKDIYQAQPGVAPNLAYPQYLKKDEVLSAIDTISGVHSAKVAMGEELGVHVGRGSWSTWTEVTNGTRSHNLQTAVFDIGKQRIPVQFNKAPMDQITDLNLDEMRAKWGIGIEQVEPIKAILKAGDSVFVGKRVLEKGKLPETIVVKPHRVAEFTAGVEKLKKEFLAEVDTSPLRQREAFEDETWAHMRRNYKDRVDQWMPEVTEKGIVAVAGDAEVAAMHRAGWHAALAGLMERAQKSMQDQSPLGLTKPMEAVLRLDADSVKALGMGEKTFEALQQIREFVNEQRAVARGAVPFIEPDASIGLVDRYRALSQDIVANPERRWAPMYGNHPILTAAEYATKAAQRVAYHDETLRAIADVYRRTHRTGLSDIPVGDVPVGMEAMKGVPLSEALDPQGKFRLFEDSVPPKSVLEQIRKSLEADGTLRKPADNKMLEQQLESIGRTLLPDSTLQEMKTFNEGVGNIDMPETEGIFRSLSNFTTAFKAYTLSAISTPVRDGISSIFNAVIMSDFNPLSFVNGLGRKALSFARGAAVDPGEGIRDIELFLAKHQLPSTPANRGVAFQSLWAAHYGAPSRHVNVETADPSTIFSSGKSNTVFDTIPGRGAGDVNTPPWKAALGDTQSWFARAWQEIKQPGTFNPRSPRGPFGSEGPLSFGNVPGLWKKDSMGRTVQNARGNVITEGFNSFRSNVDTTVRATFVMDQLQKGRTVQEALAEADRVLLNADPRNFTRFERKFLRSVMPFYSFIRQTIPLFTRELATNPGGRLGQTIRATRLSQGDEQGYVPFQYQDTTAIPLGSDEEGNMKYLTSLGLMHEDAIKYMGDALQGDVRGLLQKVISSGNPGLKWAVEWATNTSLFSQSPMGGRRLDDLDPSVGRILTNVGLQDLGPSGRPTPFGSPMVESLLAASPASRAISLAKIATSPQQTSLDKLMRILAGAKVEVVTKEQTVREIRDRVNAMQIESGARPLTIVSGTDKLQEELKAMGREDEAAQLARMEKVLNLLRKQVSKKDKKP